MSRRCIPRAVWCQRGECSQGCWFLRAGDPEPEPAPEPSEHSVRLDRAFGPVQEGGGQ